MPEKIGPYTVVSQLGRGGMGTVYKARDESLNRFVAIKVLNEQLVEDATLLQRFVREAQAAAGLSHPNIVQIYYIGEDGGHPYFVMEFVGGQSLDQLLRAEGRIDNPRASQVILQAAHGLAAAHDKGIIHRDIKPANLILDDHGILKIADFGLALPMDARTQLTQTGMFVGTPGYLAPEQCAGEKADHRTDIYALGVSFYLLLTGTPPFRGDSPLALVRQIMDTEPADVSTLNPNVDEATRKILGKMIAKDRGQRYQSSHDLVADLEDYLAARGVRNTTSGLSTRKPLPAPGLTSAPTMVLPANESPTLRETPLAAPKTLPNIPAQPPAQPPRSTSRATIALIVLAIAMVVGAAAFGAKMFLDSQRPQQASAVSAPQQPQSKTAGTTAPAPVQDGVLLLQPIKPAASTTETVAPPPAPDPASPRQTPRVPVTKAATAEKPQTSESPRPRKGVAVAVTGDAGLSPAVSSVIRSEFEAAGIEVIDAHAHPATEDLLRRGEVSAARLIDRLGAEGYAVLVLARIDPTGQRELSYYGRHDIAYSSRVTLTAYDLATGKPISSSRSANVEYTSINAESESEDVVGPLAKSVASAIRSH